MIKSCKLYLISISMDKGMIGEKSISLVAVSLPE